MRQATKQIKLLSKLDSIMRPEYNTVSSSRRVDFINWAQQELNISRSTAAHYYHKLLAKAPQDLKNRTVEHAVVRKTNKYIKAVKVETLRWVVGDKSFSSRAQARTYAKQSGRKVVDSSK